MSSIIEGMGARLRTVAFSAIALAVIVPGIAFATHTDDGVGVEQSAASTTTLVDPCALFDTRGYDPGDPTRSMHDQNEDGEEDDAPTGDTPFDFYAYDGNGPVANPSIGEFNVETTTTVGEYSQGGAAGCDVPDNATGVFLNIVTLNTTWGGNLSAFAFEEGADGETKAGVIVMNSGLNLANAVYVALDGDLGDPDLTVYVNSNPERTLDIRGVLLGYTSGEPGGSVDHP